MIFPPFSTIHRICSLLNVYNDKVFGIQLCAKAFHCCDQPVLCKFKIWRKKHFTYSHLLHICVFALCSPLMHSKTVELLTWSQNRHFCLSAQGVCVCFPCLFCWPSVWWRKRARSTWAGYVELIASCKKALSQMWFHKTPLFPRTKMHTVDWRTKRGTSRARCANPDCRARQTNYVKKKYVQGSIVTIQLLGAAVARRFAREGLTVAVARYL